MGGVNFSQKERALRAKDMQFRFKAYTLVISLINLLLQILEPFILNSGDIH